MLSQNPFLVGYQVSSQSLWIEQLEKKTSKAAITRAYYLFDLNKVKQERKYGGVAEVLAVFHQELSDEILRCLEQCYLMNQLVDCHTTRMNFLHIVNINDRFKSQNEIYYEARMTKFKKFIDLIQAEKNKI